MGKHKYEVRWRELRYVHCYAEVYCDNPAEAVMRAQDYEVEVQEQLGDTCEQLPAHTKFVIED